MMHAGHMQDATWPLQAATAKKHSSREQQQLRTVTQPRTFNAAERD